MTPEAASHKKIRGHKIERIFSEIIGGVVQSGTGKADVIDAQGMSHSVKSSHRWQIFLYERSPGFENNTSFQQLGAIADLMIQCIDVFPVHRSEYESNKQKFKNELRIPMRALNDELAKPDIKSDFLEKIFFNDGEVDYLSVLPKHLSDGDIAKMTFHVFSSEDVVRVMSDKFIIENSRARAENQTDAQKVLFRIEGRSTNRVVNVGEIELRNDSHVHYRRMKCRVDGPKILTLLQDELGAGAALSNQVLAYGGARYTLSL